VAAPVSGMAADAWDSAHGSTRLRSSPRHSISPDDVARLRFSGLAHSQGAEPAPTIASPTAPKVVSCLEARSYRLITPFSCVKKYI